MAETQKQSSHTLKNKVEVISRELENANALIRILSIVAQEDSLEKLLDQAVDELLSVSWLSLLPKAGIFTVNEAEQALVLVSKKRLTPELHSLCAKVPFGHCLCGRAAAELQVQYAKCVDDRHEVSFEGMAPHGHYNIPLLLGKKLLGVLVVYLPHGHEKNDLEVAFLKNVANTLSLIIQVKNKEAALNESRNELKSYLSDLDFQNASLQKQAEELIILSEEQHELRSQAEILEQKALHASRHDMLTDLPNRNYFNLLCRKSLSNSQRENKNSILLFLDIDGFKTVNDTLGHTAGDELLVKIAHRLKENIREEDVAARFGGDEFIVFLQGLPSVEQGKLIALKIITALKKPFNLEAGTTTVGASCGIAIYPDHSKSIETLIDIADKAMYTVKSSGKNDVLIAPL
ncbi:MAG: hypothetical protein COB54_01335 [Alphaproteobacteria bacterium]|nr:MAG: hypothetical protein COB54_01335 [Alphaproteobacteria bacterium]